jgi:hypothetical protein
MIIKNKLIVRIIGFFLAFILTVDLVIKLFNGKLFSSYYWLILIIYPFLLDMFVFSNNTLRINLQSQGLSLYYKIGIGALVLREERNWKLAWNDIKAIYSLNPTWFPIQMIGVYGLQGKKKRQFFIGTFTTQKKESLIYIADHVQEEVIDKEVMRFIKRYRRQLDRKLSGKKRKE